MPDWRFSLECRSALGIAYLANGNHGIGDVMMRVSALANLFGLRQVGQEA
jgi:hypothetical protein